MQIYTWLIIDFFITNTLSLNYFLSYRKESLLSLDFTSYDTFLLLLWFRSETFIFIRSIEAILLRKKLLFLYYTCWCFLFISLFRIKIVSLCILSFFFTYCNFIRTSWCKWKRILCSFYHVSGISYGAF